MECVDGRGRAVAPKMKSGLCLRFTDSREQTRDPRGAPYRPDLRETMILARRAASKAIHLATKARRSTPWSERSSPHPTGRQALETPQRHLRIGFTAVARTDQTMSRARRRASSAVKARAIASPSSAGNNRANLGNFSAQSSAAAADQGSHCAARTMLSTRLRCLRTNAGFDGLRGGIGLAASNRLS